MRGEGGARESTRKGKTKQGKELWGGAYRGLDLGLLHDLGAELGGVVTVRLGQDALAQ